MRIHEVHQGIQGHRPRKRVGRGPGSGHGKTAGRGHKGQKSRAGWSRKPVFQGGAMPLVRRVPKRGFHNRFAQVVVSVNLGAIDRRFEDGAEVTIEALREHSLIPARFDEVKILGEGTLTKKLKIAAHRFSASAKQKIAEAGGEAIVVAGKTPVAVKQRQAREASRKS